MSEIVGVTNKVEDYDDEPGVRADKFPVALRVLQFLQHEGVEIKCEPPIGVGHKIGSDGWEWTQLNIRQLDHALGLGQAIIARCGKSVTFGQLILPGKHIVYSSMGRAGDVVVRHLIDYRPGRDDYAQRWDVIVKATRHD